MWFTVCKKEKLFLCVCFVCETFVIQSLPQNHPLQFHTLFSGKTFVINVNYHSVPNRHT